MGSRAVGTERFPNAGACEAASADGLASIPEATCVPRRAPGSCRAVSAVRKLLSPPTGAREWRWTGSGVTRRVKP